MIGDGARRAVWERGLRQDVFHVHVHMVDAAKYPAYEPSILGLRCLVDEIRCVELVCEPKMFE